MRARRTYVGRALVFAVVWLGLLGAPLAGSDDFRVIVHPDNPARSIDRGFLRDAFLKKTTRWSHGPPIRPIDLPPAIPARDRFASTVLKKSRAQLKSYWSQQIFSGKGAPPPAASSVAETIAYVLANPGAVAYLPADADPGRAKVIPLD